MGKVLFVVHALNIGGVGTTLTNIANNLAQRGHEITIVVASDKIDGARNLSPQINLKHKDEPKHVLLKRVLYIRNFFESGMWSRRKKACKLYDYFVGKQEKYDVEVAFFFGRPLKIVYGTRNRQSRKILWIHTDYKYGAERGYLSGFKDTDEALSAYRFFDKVVCVSKGVKQSFEEVIGRTDRIEIVHNINNLETIKKMSLQSNDIERKCFTFVYVGRLSSEKGVIRLLESTRRLKEENYLFELWIVGDGAERECLERYVQEYHMDACVHFLGNQTNPYSYMAKADMLVCPSECEAYGMVIAEAFILGKPVISTDCVGPRELLADGEYGLLVENNADGIYNGMKQILNNKHDFEHYSMKANQRKVFLEQEDIIKEIETIFFEREGL